MSGSKIRPLFFFHSAVSQNGFFTTRCLLTLEPGWHSDAEYVLVCIYVVSEIRASDAATACILVRLIFLNIIYVYRTRPYITVWAGAYHMLIVSAQLRTVFV